MRYKIQFISEKIDNRKHTVMKNKTEFNVGWNTNMFSYLATASSTAHRQFGTSDFWMRGRQADIPLTNHEQLYMLELGVFDQGRYHIGYSVIIIKLIIEVVTNL